MAVFKTSKRGSWPAWMLRKVGLKVGDTKRRGFTPPKAGFTATARAKRGTKKASGAGGGG